jgi:hypothetical protein
VTLPTANLVAGIVQAPLPLARVIKQMAAVPAFTVTCPVGVRDAETFTDTRSACSRPYVTLVVDSDIAVLVAIGVAGDAAALVPFAEVKPSTTAAEAPIATA